jgi:hypothetical protein
MLQASGLPRLFCDMFIEERESMKEKNRPFPSWILIVLISAILCSFTVRQAELSEIQNWKNRIKKSSKMFRFADRKM